MSSRTTPPSLTSLTKRMSNLATTTGRPVRRIQRAVANTVVGQLLPPGVVKGGTALKLRIGESGSRFTPDLDAARTASMTLADYIAQLDDNLEHGWGGFTGRVIAVAAPEPEGVPSDYVMQPFDIKLQYRNKPWLTVRFELGHDEIGSTAVQDLQLAQDLITLFEELGLDKPSPIPVLAVEHQVAQKLHACTSISAKTGRNERAHDLVDLQLLNQDEGVDPDAVGPVAGRLFAARRTHSWPPTVVAYAGWGSIYAEAAEGLAVLPTVDEAVVWANALIARMPRQRA